MSDSFYLCRFKLFRDGENIGATREIYSFDRQHNNIRGLKIGSYSYFIENFKKFDPYPKHIKYGNDSISGVRLSRICNDDNSDDLITQISIPLDCEWYWIYYLIFLGGKKSVDSNLYYQSSFLSTNEDLLFVAFGTDNNKYFLCSYSMYRIDAVFDNIWDKCQDIEDKDDFENVIFKSFD